jgi:YkoY family integral membrane protein
VAGTFFSLVLLEAALSADNAVAIAALVRELEPPPLRARALHWGVMLAFPMRILVISLAAWVVRYSAVQAVGGLYLLWLAARHFQSELSGGSEECFAEPVVAPLRLGVVIGLVGLTDLAFSLDSITAAVAVTDQLWLVVSGAAVGVVMLRFLAGWVIGWMERFINLRNAAYLTVTAVGFRLFTKAYVPALAPSEPAVILMILLFFVWGFGQRHPQIAPRSGIGV